MKNTKNLAKRSLALMLALVMCLGLLGTTAFADEEVAEAPVVEGQPADVPGNDVVVDEDEIVVVENKYATSTLAANGEYAIAPLKTYYCRVKIYGSDALGGTFTGPTYSNPTYVTVTMNVSSNFSWSIPAVDTYFSNYGKCEYVSVSSNSSGNKQPGSSILLQEAGCTLVYYFSGSGSSSGSNKMSFTVNHDYYTNGSYDGRYTETYERDAFTSYGGSVFASEMTKRTSYNGNSYTYSSADPSSIYVTKGSTGNQGTFTLRYDRTVQVAPSKPTDSWVQNNANVVVMCQNTDATHTTKSATYNWISGTYSIGDVYQSGSNYYCNLTVTDNYNTYQSLFVNSYSGGVSHERVSASPSMWTLTWNSTYNMWSGAPTAYVSIKCETPKPEPETAKYWVYWVAEGTYEILKREQREAPVGTVVSVSDDDKAVTFEGYTFNASNTYNHFSDTLTKAGLATRDALRIYYKPDPKPEPAVYNVEWIDEDDPSNFLKVEERTGTIGDIVEVYETDKYYEGYTFDPDYTYTLLSGKLVGNYGVLDAKGNQKDGLRMYFKKNPTTEPDPEPETYTVTYRDNVSLNDHDGTVIETKEYTKGDKVVALNHSKEGKTFLGWNTDWFQALCGNASIKAGEVVTPSIDKDWILYAVYAFGFGGSEAEHTYYSYTVNWYDVDTEASIKDQVVRQLPQSRLGTTVSVSDDDKVVEGYTFVEDDSRNVTETTLEKEGTALKLYFRKNGGTGNGGGEGGDNKDTTYSISVTKKIDGESTVASGSTVNYTVVVTNTGTGTLHDLTVTDVMPAGLTFNGTVTSASNGSVTASSNNGYTWELKGNIVPGATVTLTYSATVSNTGDENVDLVNTVTAVAKKGATSEGTPAMISVLSPWIAPIVGGYVSDTATGNVTGTPSDTVSATASATVTVTPGTGSGEGEGEGEEPATKPKVSYADDNGDVKSTEEIGDGTTVKTPEQAGVEVPEGKELDHWVDQNGNEYKPNDSLADVEDDIVLTPVWKDKDEEPATKPSVSYKDDNGDVKSTEEIGDDTTVKTPEQADVEVPEGKELDHWVDQNGKEYKPNDSLADVEDDIVLTPVWKDKDNGNGGGNGGTTTPEPPVTPGPTGPTGPTEPTEPTEPSEPDDSTDIPDEEPPLADIPDEEPPLAELPDEEPPLAGTPSKPSKPSTSDNVTIEDEDVPLADIPKTGDESATWFYLAVLSASSLLCLLAVELKKSKKN